MYFGPLSASLDVKGRGAVPTRYREALGKDCVLTGDPAGCLLLMPLAHWAAFEERVNALPNLSAGVRAMQMLWLSRHDLELDAAGRIVIPPEYREMARIDRKVYFVGVKDRVEIWSEARWLARIALAEKTYAELPSADLSQLAV